MSQNIVHSSGNQTKPFNLGRLAISISSSFSHSSEDGKESALSLAQTVEDALLNNLYHQKCQSNDNPSLTTSLIAEITYDTLKRYDELAAMQYAAKHQLITSLRRPGRPSSAWREQHRPE